MIIECKQINDDLNNHINQLHRYFHVTKARFGILTNGVEYRFYSDLDEQNIMDKTPFFIFNVHNFKESDIDELKKFSKDKFNLEMITSTASILKYNKLIKDQIKQELSNPSEEFKKFLISKTIDCKRLTSRILDEFSSVVIDASHEALNDLIQDRLNGIISRKTVTNNVDDEEISSDNLDSKIITTEEELEGYRIVKAIGRRVIDVSRIVDRDQQSYFGILFDNNNRKPICRLHFNTKQKYIGFIGENKKEIRYPIDNLDEIYDYEESIIEAIKRYL